MSPSVTICNLKSITKLRFEIPDRGVWLLTASNGGGKTSLLACLRRIGYPNAFPLHFPTSLASPRLDNHSKGTVTYEINGEAVEYAYRGERWTPQPRGNSHLFQLFGYSAVVYIGATADRITPRPEDFKIANIRPANPDIVNAANDIFDTRKFAMLRTINLKRGAGNDAFVLALSGTPQTFHSEKHFSLGELCVLKLLRLIKEIKNNSMVIIDELELALHPRAQVKLLRHLEKQAQAKKLTIIFSTHSVTLLKSIDRRKIIYLERGNGGEINPVVGCFPTYAIGNIASEEESLPDIMLYVEDLLARDILSAFYERLVAVRFSEPSTWPTTKILPVGPFDAVVAFLARNRSVLPDYIKQVAILDGDVRDETLATWKKTNNNAQLAKFDRVKNVVKYLPFTPEVGLMDYIANNTRVFDAALQRWFSDNSLSISAICRNYDGTLIGPSRRRAAKKSIEEIISHVARRTARSTESIQERICTIFAHNAWPNFEDDFTQLLAPLIN